MFIQTFKYSLLRSIRQKELLFWSILFPVILGTLYKAAFGNINEIVHVFHQIPVAYVEGEEPQPEFQILLEELEQDNELIQVKAVEKDKAEKLLEQEKVKGIFQNDRKITLIVVNEEISTSILKSIQEQYEQVAGVFSNIAQSHPEKLEKVSENLGKQWNYLKDNSVTNRELDMIMDYFYALVAMTCLYACFSGIVCVSEFKANLSQLAARRVASSTSHAVIMSAEIGAQIIVQFLCTVLAVGYLHYVLKVNLGEQTGRILLVILLGNVIGVMTGVFIGSIGKLEWTVKEGICVGATMFGCFLGGLMSHGMYQQIEEYAPVINRINPASLIVRALYSLNIYDSYNKYNECILLLLGLAAVLSLVSYFLVRRERYASI